MPRPKKKRMTSSCPHVTQSHPAISWALINSKDKGLCSLCDQSAKEVWLCVTCLLCCGNHTDISLDHSSLHAKKSDHQLAMNLTTQRFWCYSCDGEVFQGQRNKPEFSIPEEGISQIDWDLLNGAAVLRTPLKGVVGLRNLGNTCYMSSALQCLSNCWAMTSYFLGLEECDAQKAKKLKVSSAYRKLIKEMWSVDRPRLVVPTNLLRTIQSINPSFRGFQQQDTQELLRCLIDHLHEELKHPATYDPPTHLTSDSDDSELRTAKYESVIADLFNGLIKSSVKCLHCEKISITKEAFQDLSLPIPSGDQLQRLHSKSEPSGTPTTPPPNADGGDNMYSCESCKKLRNGEKRVSIVQLPEVMCIHLKRFRHDFTNSSKIGSYVSFPIRGLDIGQYVKSGSQAKGSNTIYNLTGVIVHHGSVSGGHYTAYALHPATQTWYEYDDSYVTEVAEETVALCQAYVLFYTRNGSVEQRNFREKFMTQIRSVRKPSLMRFYVSKHWLFKFFTCSDPGPISNGSDYLCVHGAVRPSEYQSIDSRVVELSADSWHLLHQRYGGGPGINKLIKCQACQETLHALEKQKDYEKRTFLKMQAKPSNNLYAISLTWFRKWEAFIEGNREAPPGPIDNKSIVTERSERGSRKKYALKRSQESYYGSINGPNWRFLKRIYGGGPEAIYSRGEQEESDDENDMGGVIAQPTTPSVQSEDEESTSSQSTTHDRQMSPPAAVHRTRSQIDPTILNQSKSSINSQSDSCITNVNDEVCDDGVSSSLSCAPRVTQSKPDLSTSDQSEENVASSKSVVV